ncbi:hypothetical protein [Paeniglutamicibacter sp.]|uniref:hypothetical protein n=1 Tax=Paeniglutamicibacter sp. TaxID=1934391 RepID=UPI003989C38C
MTWKGATASGSAACARALLVAAVGAGALLGVSGCSVILHSSRPCMPPNYTLDSLVIAPGGTLRISAPDATCDPRYGEDAKVRIDLVNGHQDVLLTELAPMSDAGAFTHTMEIPASLTPGTYGISAAPDRVDWCDDTGHNNRVENPGFGDSGLLVVRAACAVPHVDFRVTR